MAKRQFEIQGSTLRIGGVDLEAGTTGVVIPGITQATNYRVEEVEDTGNQTYQFATNSEVVVIDIALYNAIVEEGDVTHFADFTATTDDEGYIDEIEVNGQGTYNGGESAAAAGTDMKAYIGSGSASDRPLVEQDWISIPFRPKMRPKDVETVGGGGGGAESLEDLSDISLNNVQDGQALVWNDSEEKWENQDINGGSSSSIEYGGSQVNIPTSDGPVLISVNEENSWQFQSGGQLIFPDGSIQTTAYTGDGQQYGYINKFTHSTNDNVDMEAVAMDSLGNSYVSYSYYDNDFNGMRGGIIKLDNAGSVQWNYALQSSNTNGEYVKINSLEHTEVNGTDTLVAIGYYYDNSVNKDRGFMWLIDPSDGDVGTMFDTETGGDFPTELSDAVFGLDASSQPFAVLVGNTYNEVLSKTFTPLAGSGLNKIVVSWSEFNASGIQPGETIYYTVGGNSNVRLNAFDVTATPDGNPANGGVNIQVSTNQNGTYNILRTNGWSGVIGGWTDPVNVRVLGSYLGGVDGTNDLTFDFSASAINSNSDNVAGWSSNIQGTAISDVVGFGYGDKDWSTEIGNTLTFDYQLNRQAYITRLGNNSWGKSIGGSSYEQLNSVVVDSSGNTYACGYYWNGLKASLVIKFDIDGNQQWAVYVDPANNTGNSVTSIDLLSDGNLIVVDEEGYVTKINSGNGSIIWQVRVDPNNDIDWDSDFRGTATPDGNYIFTNDEEDDYTLYVLCVSGTDGSEIWSKRITRFFAGTNGEFYIQDDFDAQCIDCNATSVTIAASTYIYINGNSTDGGVIINIPIDGENTDGTYGEYIIESVDPGWSTESTTSTSATISTTTTPVTAVPSSPTSTSITFTMSENIIGESDGPNLGDIIFDGSRLSSPAPGSGDFPQGVITLSPGNTTDSNFANYGQFLNIYPTTAFDSPHIHIAAGEGTGGTGSLILGPDNYHIDVSNMGNIYVKTNSQNHTWTFDNNGHTTLPGHIYHDYQVITYKPVTQYVGAGVGGTIWDSILSVQAIKFLVHGIEDTTGKSQSCEVLVTKDNNGSLATTVYAIVHTSTNPLYTLNAAYDSGSGYTRLDATVPGANNISFTVHVTAIYND